MPTPLPTPVLVALMMVVLIIATTYKPRQPW
jgi:hypothetical protein